MSVNLNHRIKSIVLKRLSNKTPILLCDNCWGGSVYSFCNIPYYSPLIGTYLYPESFIPLLKDFPSNFRKPLRFTSTPKHGKRKDEPEYYPVGVINDNIEIYFLHYKSEDEVKEKWVRRVDRMLSVYKETADLFIKMDDSNFATKNDFASFHSLPFNNKISFSKEKMIQSSENFEIKLKDQWVSGKNTSYNFDLIHWLNTGEAKQTLINRVVRSIYDSATYV